MYDQTKIQTAQTQQNTCCDPVHVSHIHRSRMHIQRRTDRCCHNRRSQRATPVVNKTETPEPEPIVVVTETETIEPELTKTESPEPKQEVEFVHLDVPADMSHLYPSIKETEFILFDMPMEMMYGSHTVNLDEHKVRLFYRNSVPPIVGVIEYSGNNIEPRAVIRLRKNNRNFEIAVAYPEKVSEGRFIVTNLIFLTYVPHQ